MALDDLYQLDPTSPVSNSNYAGANIAESCSPAGINNALRALGSMAARAIGYQGSAISSSVSTNLATASSGLAVAITGANAISSFGVVPGEQPSAAVLRIVEYSSSASLSHSANLFLVGGVSRRTQPGDVGMYLHQGSSDRWKELFYSRADGGLPMDSLSVTTITNRSMSTSAISTVTLNAASASVTAINITALNSVNSISASVGSFTLLTGPRLIAQRFRLTQGDTSVSNSIPRDNTIPQSGEGDQIFASQAVTPRNASSIIRHRATVYAGGSTTIGVAVALFKSGAAGALDVAAGLVNGTNGVETLVIDYQESASNTTERSYYLRAGPSSGTMHINGSEGDQNLFGAVLVSKWEIEEILP